VKGSIEVRRDGKTRKDEEPTLLALITRPLWRSLLTDTLGGPDIPISGKDPGPVRILPPGQGWARALEHVAPHNLNCNYDSTLLSIAVLKH
jgi:hypothetical protein